jgi:hypothetical protein
LKEHGLNNDPDHVFRVENGAIHVSGKEFGYVITRKEFANYYLRAEFKRGKVRTRRARDRRVTAGFCITCKASRRFGRGRWNFRSSRAEQGIFG